MATPAQVAVYTAGTRDKRESFSDRFEDFLRAAPPTITVQFIREKLLRSGKGFMTNKEISNRITQAQAKDYLSSQDKDRVMKNRLSGKIEQSAAPRAPQETISHPPQANGNGSSQGNGAHLERAMGYLDDAEDVAELALLEDSVSREELIRAILTQAAAFRRVFGSRPE